MVFVGEQELCRGGVPAPAPPTEGSSWAYDLWTPDEAAALAAAADGSGGKGRRGSGSGGGSGEVSVVTVAPFVFLWFVVCQDVGGFA